MPTLTATPLTAATEASVVVLTATLAFVALEYRGAEFLAWLRRHGSSVLIVAGAALGLVISLSWVATTIRTPLIAWTASVVVVLGVALVGLVLGFRGGLDLPRPGPSNLLGERAAHQNARGVRVAPRRSVAPSSPPDRSSRALEVLRIALGAIWTLNLLFIVLPTAGYWGSFSSAAAGFGASTPGGPGFANYVAAHASLFAWLIALATGYLAVSFLLGFTTRLACVVGVAASALFLWTQYSSTFAFPGGTDVGPHPLYLAIYLVLLLGGAGRYWSVDGKMWMWTEGKRALDRTGRWVAAPPA